MKELEAFDRFIKYDVGDGAKDRNKNEIIVFRKALEKLDKIDTPARRTTARRSDKGRCAVVLTSRFVPCSAICQFMESPQFSQSASTRHRPPAGHYSKGFH